MFFSEPFHSQNCQYLRIFSLLLLWPPTSALVKFVSVVCLLQSVLGPRGTRGFLYTGYVVQWLRVVFLLMFCTNVYFRVMRHILPLTPQLVFCAVIISLLIDGGDPLHLFFNLEWTYSKQISPGIVFGARQRSSELNCRQNQIYQYLRNQMLRELQTYWYVMFSGFFCFLFVYLLNYVIFNAVHNRK